MIPVYCSKCGNLINQGENFCKTCGYILNENQQQPNYNQSLKQKNSSQTEFYNNFSQNITDNDLYKEDMLINAYIGKNAYKLKNGGFSWCSLFFGFYYFIYRKMWNFALLIWLLGILTTILFKHLMLVEIIIDLIIRIILSCTFKEKYLLHVTKKVKRIKETNQNRNHEELITICKTTGGTATIVTIGIILIIMGIDSL